MPDPLADARLLVALVRLLYRTRRALARDGVLPAETAAEALVGVGRELARALHDAEAAPAGSPERAAALARVVHLSEAVQADHPWEGVSSLLAELRAGVRGDRRGRPKPPERWGQ